MRIKTMSARTRDMSQLHDTMSNSTGTAEEPEWMLAQLVERLVDAVVEQNQAYSSAQSKIAAIVTYCYSWYGLACMAMAIILNRTLVIASTNTSRAQQLAMSRRRNSVNIVRSSDIMKDASLVLFRVSIIGLLLYNAYHVLVALNVRGQLVGSTAAGYTFLKESGWFDYDPEKYNLYKYMKTSSKAVTIGPSTDMYWPIFLGFCMATYVETFTAAIQGKKPYTEAGFTLFEHSLAFQEESSGGKFFLGMSRVAQPSEELLVACLFSIANHLTFQIGGLVNNNRYRLIPSTIIGVGFLSYFAKVLFSGNGLRFPLMVIISMTPQIIMLLTIVASFVIFVMAVFATGFKFQDLNYASLFTHGNTENDPDFQARNFFKLSDDFYSTLLNLALIALTAAGKSSYITELSIVAADDETWVERSIWEKFVARFHLANSDASGIINTKGLISFMRENKINGYANLISDPSLRLVSGKEFGSGDDIDTAIQPSMLKTRLLYAKTAVINLLQLLKGIFIDKLIVSTFKRYILRKREPTFDEFSQEEYEFRKSKLPPFLRKYVRAKRPLTESNAEAKLIELDDITDDELEVNYLSLLKEKDISEVDNSLDFVEIPDSESIEEADVESLAEENNVFMTAEQFTELIDDENIDILQHHLKYEHENGIMTRSRYTELMRKQNDNKDEATKLIEVILSKRRGHLESLLKGAVPALSDDFESASLDCVICQVNTREIITWPCKCFSICESCRLTLASKGIEGCVCCRRNVEGVSRVFIP